MSNSLKLQLVAAATVLVVATANAADNDTTLITQLNRTDEIATGGTQSVVVDRIAKDFSAFSGSADDAKSLVVGLRDGSPITLDATTITPPTGKMGIGNVFISLALAQQELAAAGIKSPTPIQIQAALTGGTITGADGKTVQLQGILTQRAAGMGWGQIANSMGIKLGRLVSAIRSGNEHLADAVRHERAERAEKTEHPDRVEKTERPDKVDRPEKPQRPDRPERPGKG